MEWAQTDGNIRTNYPVTKMRSSWRPPRSGHFSDAETRVLNQHGRTGTWFSENYWNLPNTPHVMCSLSHVLPGSNCDPEPGDIEGKDIKGHCLTSYELFMLLEAIYVACGQYADHPYCTIPVQIISVERCRIRFVQGHFEGHRLRVYISHYVSLGKADYSESREKALKRIVQWAHPVPVDGVVFKRNQK